MKNWKNQFIECEEIEAKPGGKIIQPARHGIKVKRETRNARSDKGNSNRAK